MDNINEKIGRNLHKIRKERGLSLDKLAALTGVSKAMLGQIERGETNPTISVFWKIAGGLHISFSSLIEDQAPAVTIQSLHDLEPVLSAAGAYRSYPLFPYDAGKQFEIYAVQMDPGSTHSSEAHNDGVEEYIMVYEGKLEITMQEQCYTINKDSSIRFAANCEHTYHNPLDSETRYYALIFYR